MTAPFDTICSFDLETTGKYPDSDRIVTASVLLMSRAHGIIDSRNFLANPGMPIHPEATKIHGYTDEFVAAEGRPHAEVLSEVIGLLNQAWSRGIPVVAYNAAFDLSMLKANDPRFQIGGQVLDPHVIDKAADKYRRGPRRLENVAELFGVSLTADEAHGSEADSRAAGEILLHLFDPDHPRNVLDDQRFAAVLDDPEAMNSLLAKLHRADKDHLREYFKSKGKPHDDVDGGWPLLDSTLAKVDS